jgi:ribose-phosphate pyrophosphokinase
MKLISGNSNLPLAEAVAKHLGMALTSASIKRFSDMEIFVEIKENVRGEDVFLLQSTSYPANDHMMELLIALDALKRASAKRVTVVMPYFGYARQDRKPGPRTPISAKLVANIITKAGADRVLAVDLHAGQIQGFFDIPVDHLYARPVIVTDIKERYPELANVMIVSPDVGGVVRARSLAGRLGVDLAIFDKRREKANQSEVMSIIGEVKGRDCILYDDIVDTAGTMCNAADALMAQGASSVSAYVTHGVLSGPAVDRIMGSTLQSMVITDSIHIPERVRECAKIRQIPLAPLLGEAIKRISEESSVSTLFE